MTAGDDAAHEGRARQARPPGTGLVVEDGWQVLRQLTGARIALGRAGSSLPTRPQLAFQLAHARARDAVHHPIDLEALVAALQHAGHDLCCVHSAASDRSIYLQRPDLGRMLSPASRADLEQVAAKRAEPVDLVIVIADGLSAIAIEHNAVPFIAALEPCLKREAIRLAPLVLVEHGRVAIGDEIGELFGARLVAILIGERPGLSSPDSMGIYLSWQPRVGMKDSARNCLSNIHAQGLSHAVAVEKFMYLFVEARKRRLTGVALKDETSVARTLDIGPTRTFIL